MGTGVVWKKQGGYQNEWNNLGFTPILPSLGIIPRIWFYHATKNMAILYNNAQNEHSYKRMHYKVEIDSLQLILEVNGLRMKTRFLHNAEWCFLLQPNLKGKFGHQKDNQPYLNIDQTKHNSSSGEVKIN